MRDDPEPRADGCCVTCGEQIQRRTTDLSRRLDRTGVDLYGRDPFCSSVCCRAFYGVTFSSDARKPDHRGVSAAA